MEHEAKEKAKHEARERAEWEAQEKERCDVEFQERYTKEQQRKHEVGAQQVAEVKQLQLQVRMLEVSRYGRNGELDVISSSPSPAYIRLIWRQVALVSVLENRKETVG